MNRNLPFFDYNKCFEHYAERIANIRQARIQGEIIVAKPVFLLAIIDEMDEDIFVDNCFVINYWLEERYDALMRHYTKGSQFNKAAGIEKPFWHLESDGFWHLNYPGERLSKERTQSKAWLKEHVHFAYFDEALWVLLENQEWRTKLRNFIVEHKLSNQ